LLQYPLAFEASLSPDCRELRLTIIAQSSYVVQSQAIELLDQFEQSLRTTLNEAGTNIISNTTVTNGVNGDGSALTDSSSTDISSMDGERVQCEPFRWTRQAIQIRQEVASLASIDEDKVHETSSIFELGLDSIDVIKLSSRLSKRGIAIPVSAIIKSQTLEKMSLKISGHSNRTDQAATGKTVKEIGQDLTKYLKDKNKLPEDVETILPATPLQQSMVNEMVKSDYTRYFTVEAFEIDKKIILAELLQAVKETVVISPILRTTFTEIDDPRSPVSYAQIVHKNRAPFVEMVGRETFGSLGAYLDHLKTKKAVLAASRQALFQIRCFSAGQSRYLILGISHALYDGRSLRAVHEDIQKAYHKKLSPRPDSLPYLELVFQSTTDDAKQFWRSALSSLPAATFPRKEFSDVPDPNEVHRLETQSRVALKDVESFCRFSRITLQTLGQTCWAIVLSHLMGQLDVVFGSVLSCRDSEEADEVMFPLMNTVAVRAVLHGSVREMLRYMQEMSDSTRQYQHFPLGTAQAYALASRDSGSSIKDTTLFDTLFIYQGRRQPQETDPLYRSVYGSSDVEFPVCVEMEIVDNENLSWTTACKSIARTAMETEEIIAALDSVLQRIIDAPQARIIVSDAQGISVCGLPKFRKSESLPRKSSSPTLEESGGKWSDLELKIRQVLHEVSGVPLEGIQKDSTIFHLGLDSILILKLPALLRQHGVKLSVSNILKEQTAYAMARSVLRADLEQPESLDVEQTLANALSSLNVSSAVRSLKNDVGEVQYVMPVTGGQQYMIRSWQASRGTLFYPTFEYTLLGAVDKARLDDAWKILLRNHDILRTGFVETELDLIQVVFKDTNNGVVYQGSEGRPAPKILSDLKFPPVALTVYECHNSMTKVKLEIHHALYDGISLPLLMDHLQSLYQGQSVHAPELSFRKFVAQSIAASDRAELRSSSSAKTLTQAKWESYLKHESLSSNTVDGTSTSIYSKRTEVFHPTLMVLPLKKVAQGSSVSVDALLLAAVSKVYAQRVERNNKNAVVFGIYLANRAPFGEDLSRLVAPTLNLLPLYVQDPLGRDLPEIAKDIQRDLQEISSAEMSCASLAQIYEWCGVRVNFFVNILKDRNSDIVAPDGTNGANGGEEFVFEQTQDLIKRAEVVEGYHNEDIVTDAGSEAYLVSLLKDSWLVLQMLIIDSLPWTLRSDIRGIVLIWGCLAQQPWFQSTRLRT
jgi:aryl carrier-like protein